MLIRGMGGRKQGGEREVSDQGTDQSWGEFDMEAAVVVSSRSPNPEFCRGCRDCRIRRYSQSGLHGGEGHKNKQLPAPPAGGERVLSTLRRFADHLRPSILDMAQIKGLNAHDRPPEAVRQCYKKYTRCSLSDIDNDPEVLDIQRLDPDQLPASIAVSQYMSSQDLRLAFDDFIRGGHALDKEHAPLAENIPVFTHNAVSGQHRLASA